MRVLRIGIGLLALIGVLGCHGARPNAPSIPGAYFLGRIVPVAESPESESMRPWRSGAYLHMREDGAIGFNASGPSDYAYQSSNQWALDDNKLTLTLGDARYHFDLDTPNPPLRAFLDPGGAFEMTLQPIRPAQR